MWSVVFIIFVIFIACAIAYVAAYAYYNEHLLRVLGGARTSKMDIALVRYIIRQPNMRADAIAIANAIAKFNPNIVNCFVDESGVARDQSAHERPERVIEIHFEHYKPSHGPSAKQYLIVNHEFFYDWDRDAMHAGVICVAKTRVAQQMLDAIACADRAKFPQTSAPQYTGFTTIVQSVDSQHPKNPMLAVHLAGTSPMKNTRLVIAAWLVDDVAAPHMNGAELFITRQRGKHNLASEDLDYWESLPTQPALFHDIACRSIVRAGRTIYLTDARISDEQLADIMNCAQFHICPSEMEGYGHIVNQSRAAGAIVITFDVAPMNELISASFGVLVPATKRKRWDKKFPNLKKWATRETASVMLAGCEPHELTLACERAYALDEETRARMGARARERYDEDTAFFNGTMPRVLRIASA